MSELTQFVKSKLEGKSTTGEILDAVAEQFPDASETEVLDALETAEKSFKLAFAHEIRKEEAKKEAELEAKIGGLVEKKTAEAVQAVLEKIPVQSHEPAKPKFKSFLNDIVVSNDNTWAGEMKQMLVAIAMNDPSKARQISEKFLSNSALAQKTVLRGDATTGSYAVPDEFSDMVFSIAQRDSRIFSAATKIALGSDTMYLLGSGDVSFTEVTNQATALTESEPVLTQGTLSVIDAGAFSYIHENLIADSNVNVVSLLANAYGRGMAKYVKQATTVNNVATTGDKFNGIYSTSGIGSVAVADANGAISYDDIMDLIGAIDESFLDGAHFEMNRREFVKLLKIKDGQARPIFVEPRSEGEPGTILGYPVYFNNQMPITLDSATGARTGGSPGTATILFGNASQVQIGIRGGFMLDSSRDYKFIDRQTTFRGYLRWAQAVMNPTAWARLTGIQ